MKIFIYFLNIFFNLFYGVFIPILPVLNEEYTGFAFSLYGVAKVLSYYFFGKLIDNDRLGLSLSLSLFLLLLVPCSYLLMPTMPTYAKFFEGIAFAGGTVFCFSYLTIISLSKNDFEQQVKMIVVLSSLGSLIGPALGYYFLAENINLATYSFLITTFVINIIGLFLVVKSPLKKVVDVEKFNDSRADNLNKYLVVTILLLKGVLIGIQPCIAWWCSDIFKFDNTMSALSYVITSVAFIIGSIRPRFGLNILPFISLLLLELSFIKSSLFFWLSLALLAFWIGQIMVKCMIELGWVTTDKAGKLNSLWLVLSDIPIIFTPMLFWSMRTQEYYLLRESILILSFIIAIFLISLHKKSKKISA